MCTENLWHRYTVVLREARPAKAADVAKRLRRHEIWLPDDLDRQLGARIRPYRIEHVESGSATELVAAWRATQSARRDGEEAWIVILSIFSARFSAHVPGLKEELASQHMSVMRTRIEIALQLASRYFHLGRHLVAASPDKPGGYFLLQEGADILAWIAETERRLPDGKRKQYHGQLACALIILSRKIPRAEVVDILLTADHHSQKAEELGDRSDEHYAYRIESALRLYGATSKADHLERASRFDLPPGASKRLTTAAADLSAERGYLMLAKRRDKRGEGLHLLQTAVAGYDQALALAGEAGIDEGYLLAKRALARSRLYRYELDPSGRRDPRWLEAALADFLDPRALPHSSRELVANALLDRARIQAARSRHDAAREDRSRARELLSVGAGSEISGKLAAAELENAILEAIKANDVPRLSGLVEAVSHLPADAVIPSAALALACKLLIKAESEQNWRQATIMALDRIEADLAHPAVTRPAVRHVAGHAALLAWLLARNTDDMDMHRRALVLYRMSFAAAPGLPSVDAQANAGTAAFVLGKALLAGDEEQGEDSASLLVDAIEWLGSALAHASARPTAARDDFDPKIVHSRLGEAALRVYPLLWDVSHLDLAIEHLEASRALGQEAPELIGLLGDSYYRRGVRYGDLGDLEQAIALKDQAYAVGAVTRENRSVTAGATLRMFRLTDQPGLVTSAAVRALEAVACDPEWPWAVLQLAEVAASSHLIDAQALASAGPGDLVRDIVHGRRGELLRRAAGLAVHTTEFQSSVLGGQQRSGQQGVRILNDPHRLIEQALVLKRVEQAEAHKERQATDDL